jgi:superoxide dismutase
MESRLFWTDLNWEKAVVKKNWEKADASFFFFAFGWRTSCFFWTRLEDFMFWTSGRLSGIHASSCSRRYSPHAIACGPSQPNLARHTFVLSFVCQNESLGAGLVLKFFFLPPLITSNIWTHTWSTKHRRKKTYYTVLGEIARRIF